VPTSVRELLLREMQRVFLEADLATSGGGTRWARVLDSPMTGRELRGQNVMSILEGSETYIDVVSPDKRDRSLEVDLISRVVVPKGLSLREGANEVLADIEEIVEANVFWGGYAYATTLLANSVEREDTGDRVVEVSVFLSVRYRTRRTNPRD